MRDCIDCGTPFEPDPTHKRWTCQDCRNTRQRKAYRKRVEVDDEYREARRRAARESYRRCNDVKPEDFTK